MLDSLDSPALLLPKFCLESWASTLIEQTKNRCYAIINSELSSKGEYSMVSVTPLSHHYMKINEEYHPLMRYYFIDFTTACLQTSPETETQKTLLSFFQEHREAIQIFILQPHLRTEQDWQMFDCIFSLKDIHSYIGYLQERSRELTRSLKDQHIDTDLFVNMSNTFHCLYRLYEIQTKKNCQLAS